jgi:hypothetical protein
MVSFLLFAYFNWMWLSDIINNSRCFADSKAPYSKEAHCLFRVDVAASSAATYYGKARTWRAFYLHLEAG